mgnify:CR=1 FL=1
MLKFGKSHHFLGKGHPANKLAFVLTNFRRRLISVLHNGAKINHFDVPLALYVNQYHQIGGEPSSSNVLLVSFAPVNFIDEMESK